MRRYDYKYPADRKAAKFLPPDAVFLDIETTGLGRENSIITVIGCAYVESEVLYLIQWFNNDAISEESMLTELDAFLKTRPFTLVTFNGEKFDLPFLKAHFYYNELSPEEDYHPSIDRAPSLDLYKALRGFAPLFPGGRSTQKSMERYAGIDREDTCNGGELIPVYRDYLKTKNETLSDTILLHNREDVRYLASIPSLLALHQLTEGEFTIESMEEDTYLNQTALRFLCRPKHALPKPFVMETHLAKIELPVVESSVCSQKDDSGIYFILTVPVYEGRMYHFYNDYKNYYYLPSEDRAVHKSVGAYVDKDHRRKANARNCYCPLDSVFLPLPGPGKGYGFQVENQNEKVLPFYRKSFDARKQYLDFDDLFPGADGREYAIPYLTSLIKTIFLIKNKENRHAGKGKKEKTE